MNRPLEVITHRGAGRDGGGHRRPEPREARRLTGRMLPQMLGGEGLRAWGLSLLAALAEVPSEGVEMQKAV